MENSDHSCPVAGYQTCACCFPAPRPSEVEDVPFGEEDVAIVETAQVQIGLRYDAKSSSFLVIIAQLRNLHVFLIPHTSKVYFRVALLPSSTDVSCLFRTKVHPAMESMLFNDPFRVAISQTALQQKTLRVDLCSVSRHRREECLAGTQISLADLPFSNEIFTLWYNLLPSKQMPCKKNEEETEDSVFQPSKPLVDSIDLVSQSWRKTSLQFNEIIRRRDHAVTPLWLLHGHCPSFPPFTPS